MEERDPFASGEALSVPLAELCKRLRLMRQGELIIAVADDQLTRREAVARLADALFGQISFSEFTFHPDDQLSLAHHVRGLLPPTGSAAVLASGLDELTTPSRREALRRLNVERESFHQTRYGVVLWIDSAMIPDLARQAGDFWAYKSALIEFPLRLEERGFEPSPLAQLKLTEADRLRHLRATYQEQLSRPRANRSVEADLRLKLSQVYDKLGQEAERAQQLRDEALSLLADLEDYQRLETLYRQALADRYRALEFIGIPELKERTPITLENIFIRLRAEMRTVRSPNWALTEQLARATGARKTEEAVTRDEPTWINLEAELQRALEHGTLTLPTASPTENERWRTELSKAIKERDANTALRLLEQIEDVRTILSRATINEVLTEHKQIVILGDPGAGKTTLLRYLTVMVAEGRRSELGLSNDHAPSLPVFIQLRDFAAWTQQEQSYHLLDYLYAHARQRLMLALPTNFFESALAAGRGLICLDGLDEVTRPEERAALVRTVAALAVRFPNNHYVVTSRVIGYDDAPLDRRAFVHCTILPFDDDDVAHFVQKWYKVREKDPVEGQRKAEDLIATIANEPRIRALADNPLMLTIIALVHRIEAQLPHERVKLYDKCVTALIETWDDVKGLTLADKQRPFYQHRRRLLERLAYWLHTNTEEPGRVQTIKRGDLELLLARFLLENKRLQLDEETAREEAQAFIRLARRRVGLLAERGEGRFGFPHLTFQEYLTACDIEARTIYDLDQMWAEIEPHLWEDHWQEVILLLLGSLNKYDDPPTLMIERILATDVEDVAQQEPLFLAARVLADRVEVAEDVRRQVVSGLLHIVGQKYVEVWDVFPMSADLRRFPRDDIASDAITALSKLKEDKDAMIGLLALTRDSKVRAETRLLAAKALSKLGRTDEAVDVLLILAHDDKVYTDVRVAATEALVELDKTDEEKASTLLAFASDNGVDAEARLWAAKALSELGRTSEAFDILSALGSDPRIHAGERLKAAEVLGELGYTDEASAILLDLVYDRAVGTNVRIEAAEALGKLGHTNEAADILLNVIRDPEVDSKPRNDATEALDELGQSEKATEALLVLAQDPDVYAGKRLEAARALGKKGQHKKAANVLLALARDPTGYPGIRAQATTALKDLVEPDVLLDLAQDTEMDGLVRLRAGQALLENSAAQPKATQALLSLADDETVGIGARTEAIYTLCRLEVDETVRQAALRTLERLKRAQ